MDLGPKQNMDSDKIKSIQLLKKSTVQAEDRSRIVDFF